MVTKLGKEKRRRAEGFGKYKFKKYRDINKLNEPKVYQVTNSGYEGI